MKFKKIAIQIFILLAYYQMAIAQMVPVPLDTSIKNSGFIFEGQVISSTPFFGPDSAMGYLMGMLVYSCAIEP